MAAPNARVIRDGQKMEVPAAELVPGDILLLEAGDVTAADGRVLQNFSLQVSESALTGESENVNKIDTPIDQDELDVYKRQAVLSGRRSPFSGCHGSFEENRKGQHHWRQRHGRCVP